MTPFAPRQALADVRRSITSNLQIIPKLGVPVLILIIVGVAQTLFSNIAPLASGRSGDPLGAVMAAASGAMSIVNILLSIVVALSWQKFLLRGEVPVGHGFAWRQRRYWRYVGNDVLLSLLAIPALLFAFGATKLASPWLAGWLGNVICDTGALTPAGKEWVEQYVQIANFLVANFGLAPVAQRLGLKLSGIACDREKYGFRTAWRDTAGQLRPIFLYSLGIELFTTLPASLCAVLVRLSHGATFLLTLPLGVLVSAVWLASTFIMATSHVVLYRIFAEGREV